MQEDTLMAAHDEQKDGKGLATNYGLYNLSQDLILDSGYSGDLDFHKWNLALDHTKDATGITLDYLRGDAPRKNIPRCATLLVRGACMVQPCMQPADIPVIAHHVAECSDHAGYTGLIMPCHAIHSALGGSD